MTKETLNNICKKPKQPFYLRIKLSPLNAYRIILFVLLSFATLNAIKPTSLYEIVLYGITTVVITFLLTTISLWTKSISKTSFKASVAAITLFILNVIAIIFSLSAFIR